MCNIFGHSLYTHVRFYAIVFLPPLLLLMQDEYLSYMLMEYQERDHMSNLFKEVSKQQSDNGFIFTNSTEGVV